MRETGERDGREGDTHTGRERGGEREGREGRYRGRGREIVGERVGQNYK